MTTLEKENITVKQRLQHEKWLLIELIYAYCWFEKGLLLAKSDLAEYSLDQLEFIVQAIENRELKNVERGVLT